jgi:hypothetical protein
MERSTCCARRGGCFRSSSAFLLTADKQLEHHFLAIAIYSTIVAVIAATVVRKEYFDKLFYKLRAHDIDTNGARDVWRFTFAIFIFNATLHTVQLADQTFASFLTYAPWRAFGWLTVFRMVYLSGNFGLWLWAAILYKRDAARVRFSDPGIDKDALFKKRKALLATYFTPAIVLFAFDDTLSKNWDFFKITDVLHSLVDDHLKTWQGWAIPITLIVFTVTAVATIVVTMFYQEKIRNIGWKMLVYAVPLSVPIASVLIVVTVAFAFSLSDGSRDDNIADDLPPAKTPQSSPSASGAPQGPAPVQNDTPTHVVTAPQSSPSESGAPQGPAPVQNDTPTHVVTAPQSSPSESGAPQGPAPVQNGTPPHVVTAPQSSPSVSGAPQGPAPVRNDTPPRVLAEPQSSPSAPGAPQSPAPVQNPTSTQIATAAQRSARPPGAALARNTFSEQGSASARRVNLEGGGNFGYNQSKSRPSVATSRPRSWLSAPRPVGCRGAAPQRR